MTTGVIVIIPFLMIVISTVGMLCVLKKSSYELRRQSIVLILSVSVLHIASNFPFLLYIILINTLPILKAVKYRNSSVAQLFATANYIAYLNTMCNPIMYYFTSTSFATYVRDFSRQWLNRIRFTGPQQPPMTAGTAVSI